MNTKITINVFKRPKFCISQTSIQHVSSNTGQTTALTTRPDLWGLYAYNSADGYARHYGTTYRLSFTYGREVAAHLAASLWQNFLQFLLKWLKICAVTLTELVHWRTLEKQPLSSLRQFCASGPLSPSLSLAPASPFLFQSGRQI